MRLIRGKMYKIITTHIAGINFVNPDDSSRMEILRGLPLDVDLKLENYYFEGEKAVKVLTMDGLCVGNIPKDLADFIYDNNAKNKIDYVIFKPKRYPDGYVIYNIKIYVKTD